MRLRNAMPLSYRSDRFSLPRQWGILAAGLLACTLLGGCGFWPVENRPTSGAGQGAAIPQEDASLLRLRLDEWWQLERRQQYAQFFDRMATGPLRQPERRRAFLELCRCAETILGPATDYRHDGVDIRYFEVSHAYEVSVPVNRQNAGIIERHTFQHLADGSLQWVGTYWQTRRQDFINCAQDLPAVAVINAKPGLKSSALTPVGAKPEPQAQARRHKKTETH